MISKKKYSVCVKFVILIHPPVQPHNNKWTPFPLQFDLSAAFETVDHQILLEFLKVTIDTPRNSWNWFQYCLSGGTQYIYVKAGYLNY